VITDEKPGRIIANLSGRITLRDPISWDVSRANRPIEPTEPTVSEVEQVIIDALTAHGFAVTVELTRTDK
jgi:hypothetical protein